MSEKPDQSKCKSGKCCPQCSQPLAQVGQFWICPQHGQISLEKPFAPLRIFLSYGHDKHADDALHIKADLERRGHQVWFDLPRLREGRDWELYIEEGLKWGDKVVLLMTPYSVRLLTTAHTQRTRKIILPFVRQCSQLSDDLAPSMSPA